MDFNEIKDSVTTTAKERFTSPLYGPVIISWVLWNWKIFYVTFFETKETLGVNRLTYITDTLVGHWLGWILPLLSAAFIILALPYISNFVLKVSKYFERKRNEILENHDKGTVVSKHDFNKLYVQKDVLEQERDEMRVRMLNSENDLKNEKADKKKSIEELRIQNFEKERLIMRLITEAVGFYSKNTDAVNHFFTIHRENSSDKRNQLASIGGTFDNLLSHEYIGGSLNNYEFLLKGRILESIQQGNINTI